MRFLAAFLVVLASSCSTDPGRSPSLKKQESGGLQNVTDSEAREAKEDRVIIPLTSEVSVERRPSNAAKCGDAAFIRLGLDQGILDCTRAIEQDSLSKQDLANTYYNRGYMYFQQARYDLAERRFYARHRK